MKTLLAGVLILAAAQAAAQPVKCVDAKGHVRYIDQSMMGQESCTPVTATTNTVSTQPGAIKPPPPPSAGNEQAARNQAAVAAAEAKLAAAKKALAEQEAIREGGERNYQRVLDRLKPYQDAVAAAQKELDAAREGGR